MRIHGSVWYVLCDSGTNCALTQTMKRALRRLVPNIPLQALVRGANGVGYTSYPYANAPFGFIRWSN
jgi:hypothetical protein